MVGQPEVIASGAKVFGARGRDIGALHTVFVLFTSGIGGGIGSTFTLFGTFEA